MIMRPTARDAIVEAAFDVLSNNPGASLSDIAERAGVGRATLHRHFSSREALIKVLAETAIKEMDAAADAACEGAESYSIAFQKTFEALIPLGDRHGFLSREPIEDDPEIAETFERQIKEMHEMIDDAKGEGLFDKQAPTAWIAQAFDHLLYAAWESVKRGEATHTQAVDLAWRTLTIGLGEKLK